jgi:hypothetical protein
MTYFSLRDDGGYSGTVSVKVSSGQKALSYVCDLAAWDQYGQAITPSTLWTSSGPVSGALNPQGPRLLLPMRG